jgi:hypothetical protein
VRDAAAILMQRTAPQERAALLLVEIFGMTSGDRLGRPTQTIGYRFPFDASADPSAAGVKR